MITDPQDIAICGVAAIIISQELNFPNLVGKITSTIGLRGGIPRQQAMMIAAGIVVSQELGFPNILDEITGLPRRFGLPFF